MSLSGEPITPVEGGSYVEGGAEKGNPFGVEGSSYSGSAFASSDGSAAADGIPTAPVSSYKSSGYNAGGSYQM